MMMLVRRERPDDVDVVRAIHAAAFERGDGEPVEARLLDALRSTDRWLDRFSIVVERDGGVVGHVVCTRALVEQEPVLALGPIAVRPDQQGLGAGAALLHAMVGAADACGEPLIGLLGSPALYARFGFVAASGLAIEPPDPAWGAHFQARRLTAYRPTITGRFRYPAPFDEVT